MMSTKNRRGLKPIVLVTGAFVVAIGLLAAGWALSSAFESPAQREAKIAPPTARPVTAPVERGALTDEVHFRGAVARGDAASIPLPPQESGPSVVTAAPRAAGSPIGAGSIVTEVNGRPVFALPGSFPFYRPLGEGDMGPDVRQLQSGLAAAGQRVATDGVFGASTSSALRALYRAAGRTPPLRASVADATSTGPDASPTRAAAPAATSAPAPARAPSDAPPAAASAPAPTSAPSPVMVQSEFVVVGTLPGFLASVPSVGAAVTAETAISVQHGSPVVVATVPKLTAERLHERVAGSFRASSASTEESAEEASEGVAVEVSTIEPGGPDDTESTVTLAGAGGALDDASLGKEGTVTLRLRLLAEDALIVPTAAVTPGGNGDAHIMVRDDDGVFRTVAVTEIAQLDGRSAIRPRQADAVAAGDHVRVD